MANPVSYDRREQTSTLRNLKFLVVVLVLSNIGLGIFSFWLLRSLDGRYSELLARSVPVLNDLQALTVKSVELMRATNPELFGATDDQRQTAASRGRRVIGAERALREQIIKAEWLPALPEGRDEFRKAGERFSTLGDEVLVLSAAGKTIEAVKLREESLRPAFEHYLLAATRAADFVEERSIKANEAYTARTGSSANLVLGIATWPLLAVLALLLFTALFLGVLMLAFRGKDLSEAP